MRNSLAQARTSRRRCGRHRTKSAHTEKGQPIRWMSVSHDSDLKQLNISREDACIFLQSVLKWESKEIDGFQPTLESLNRLIVSMLEMVPFHNLTLLVRERIPPTPKEIKK